MPFIHQVSFSSLHYACKLHPESSWGPICLRWWLANCDVKTWPWIFVIPLSLLTDCLCRSKRKWPTNVIKTLYSPLASVDTAAWAVLLQWLSACLQPQLPRTELDPHHQIQRMNNECTDSGDAIHWDGQPTFTPVKRPVNQSACRAAGHRINKQTSQSQI